MTKVLFLIFVSFSISNFSLSFAQTLTFLGETELGQRSVSEESDAQEDDLYLSKYSVGVDFKPTEKFRAEAKTAYWEKDYKTFNDLDNITRVYGVTSSYLLFRKESQALLFRFRANRREKRYPKQTALNFNQLTFQPTFLLEKRNDYSLSFGMGWNEYQYLTQGGKDQTVFYQETKVKKTLLEERLDLKSSYRVEVHEFERAGREKLKQEIEAGGTVQLYLLWLDSLGASGSFGKRDSKEIEGRDEDEDFSFWEYRLKSEHSLRDDLIGRLQFSSFENDFRTNRFDSNGWEVKSDFDYLWKEDPSFKWRFDFEGRYKNVGYPSNSNDDYCRVAAKLGSSYLKKRDWKAALGYETNFYRFNLNSQDRNRHLFFIEGGKWFREEEFYCALLVDYRFTDYFSESDLHSASATFSFRYRF